MEWFNEAWEGMLRRLESRTTRTAIKSKTISLACLWLGASFPNCLGTRPRKGALTTYFFRNASFSAKLGRPWTLALSSEASSFSLCTHVLSVVLRSLYSSEREQLLLALAVATFRFPLKRAFCAFARMVVRKRPLLLIEA